MKNISFVFLLLCVSISTKAKTETNIQDEIESERLKYTCGSEQAAGVNFRFCYRNLETTNNHDIIYFFHGLGGSEESWFTQYPGTLIIQKWWKFWGYRPRIVTVSFGPQWVLVDNERRPLLPLLVKRIMPLLESKIGGLKSGQRHLIGQSMGGYNAAEVALKYPGTFSRVALLCPAITTIGPYSRKTEIDKYVGRTGANPSLVERMLRISRSNFVDQTDWERHDPLLLLKKYPSQQKSKFYVTIGVSDGYGFQEGSEEFYFLGKTRAFIAQWAPVPGGHCNFSRRGTAYFIKGD